MSCPGIPSKRVACLIYLRTEEADRFGDRLVDGLVEAHDVVKVRRFGRTGVHPQAEHAGA